MLKYLTAPGIDLLDRSRIRVCKFANTNDSSEGLPCLDYPVDVSFWKRQFDHYVDTDPLFWMEAVIRSVDPAAFENRREAYARFMIRQKSHAEKVLPHRLRDGISHAIFFISLTESYPNETLWQRYGGNHQGFVVQFDNDHPFFQQCIHPSGQLRRIMEVDYDDALHRVCFGDRRPPVELLFKKLADKWKEEYEIRILVFHSYCEQEGDHHYVSIPRESISAVILGSGCPDELRTRIKEVNRDLFNGRVRITDEDR